MAHDPSDGDTAEMRALRLRRRAAERRVREATRGGPEWCAAMAALEAIESAIGSETDPDDERRRRHLLRGAETVALVVVTLLLSASPIGVAVSR